jgi:hypothetical protein
MKRLFAFGCSFTNYRWFTWADILGMQHDSFQNWGQSGAGNHYMFNAMMECDQRNQWTDQDTVMVCWTNVMRDDRYFEGRGWITLGNIADAQIYTKEFLADCVSERGNLLRDIALIKAAKVMLESRGVTWRFLQMCDIIQPEPWDQRKMNYRDITDLYQDVISCLMPSYVDVLGHQFWQHRQDQRYRYPGGGIDYHPMPVEHLEYLDTVLPGWVHDPRVRELVSQNDMTPSRQRNGSNQNHRL